MTDEEKEAIELLTKRYNFFNDNPFATNVLLTLDVHNLGVILKLISKMQKENIILENRLKHLLKSKIISKYDGKNRKTQEYILNIQNLDRDIELKDKKLTRISNICLKEVKNEIDAVSAIDKIIDIL